MFFILLFLSYYWLADWPGVARGKKKFEKNEKMIFVAYNTPRPPVTHEYWEYSSYYIYDYLKGPALPVEIFFLNCV